MQDSDEEEEPDAEALERKALKEAEEWRLKQIHAGVTAEQNPNFQVPSSWPLYQPFIQSLQLHVALVPFMHIKIC